MASRIYKGIQIQDLDSWKRGQVSYFSKSRMQESALKTAYNVIFDYDAVVRPRGSFSSSSIPDVPIIIRRTGASPVVSTNLITNPSFETNTTGWNTYHSATLSQSSAQAYVGSKSLQAVTTGGGSTTQGTNINVISLTPSTAYVYSAYVYMPLGVAFTVECDTAITGSFSRAFSASFTGTGAWQRVSLSVTLNSSENEVDCFVYTAASTTFYVDAAQFETGSVATGYFDGSLAATADTDYAWTGAANASTSTRSVYVLETITPQPLACDFAFKRADNSEGLLNVFTDGTTAWLYVLKADVSGWTKFTTVTFDKTAMLSFAQSAGEVVIGNGIDPFTYYDIATDTVKRLAVVADPTATPVATTAGFSGTAAIDYYYRVAFGGIGGSTKMTPFVKVTSSTIRDTWGSAKSVMIDISAFIIDPNAQNWSVYVASVSTGTGAPTDSEYLLVTDSLPVTQKQVTDTGASTTLQSAPVENTTAGIKAWYFTNISGRLWAIGMDGLIYWGGDIGHELYFGSANGSDSYKINNGSNEKAMAISLGRDNSGTTCINLLTRTMAGQGAIWDVYATTNSISANGQTFSTGTYQFKKREGNDGTDAPFSVIRANNNAYYLSMEGFKSTGVKPNVVGIQSTDIISSAIRDRVLNLAQSNIASTYAAHYDEALYWTVAYGAQKNNEIWVYDILHGGIWSIWRIQADCIFRWASTKNESPSLYIRQGNKLLRYYKNSHSHADLSGTFESYIESGLVPFSKDALEWMHLLKTVWQFDQAVGQVELVMNVHAASGDIIKVNQVLFTGAGSSTAPSSGWDAIRVSADLKSRGAWGNRSWEETVANLLDFKDPSDKKISQKIRKNAAYISFSVRANTKDTYYELSHLSMLFTYIGLGIEFLSQKGVIKI